MRVTGTETFFTESIPSNFNIPSGSSKTTLSMFTKFPPPERFNVFAPIFKSPPEWDKVLPEEISMVEPKL